MIGSRVIAGAILGLWAGAALAQAGQYGSAAEARAMLDRVVAAVRANKATALASFTRGEAGFKDRDLYPFCAGPDGLFTAHPTLTGRSLAELKDWTGKAFGAEIRSVAREGRVAEVTYAWPRPDGFDASDKTAFVTRIGDQVCAVGYYR